VSGGGAAVTGNVSATGDVSGVGGTFSGDVSARGLTVSRVVRGKVYGGALTDTSATSTTLVNVAVANVQNVPVIAGHAYRATYQVSVGGTILNDRIRFALWNGSIGGTQLGSHEPLVRITQAGGTVEVAVLVFVWAQPSTQTISNVNLSMHRFTGTGTVTTRIESTSFAAVVEDLGLTGTISGL
jgi:hypothetical protein